MVGGNSITMNTRGSASSEPADVLQTVHLFMGDCSILVGHVSEAYGIRLGCVTKVHMLIYLYRISFGTFEKSVASFIV